MTGRSDASVFLTWNDSRRSASLGARLGARRVVFAAERRGALRHLAGAVLTARFLARSRPTSVWYQFSLLLGVLLAGYERLAPRGHVRLIADLHTKALRREGPPGVRRVIAPLKRWALARCAHTVVSNADNVRYVETRFGIRPLVLPDPLPRVPTSGAAGVVRADVVFVCSFARDEPVVLIAEAAARLAPELRVAITGEPRHLDSAVRRELKRGAWLTGFLPDAEYWTLLRNARCVVVLSREPACLPCGAYEAIAIGHRPVVACDVEVMRAFGECAVYSKLEPDELVDTVLQQVRDGVPGGDPRVAAEYRAGWKEHWRAVSEELDG